MGKVIGPAAFAHAFKLFEGATLKGDVNCDGVVDINDANALIDVILESDANQCHAAAADVNADGYRDGTDVQAFLTVLL
jgi:hypothetical protein